MENVEKNIGIVLEGALAQTPEVKKSEVESLLEDLNDLSGINATEVELPILGCTAIVTPIKGSDEVLTKTLKASGYQFISLFNSLIYNHTRFEGLAFDNVEDFQNHITAPDKMVLVFALLSATYTTLPATVLECPHCGEQQEYHFKPSDMLHSDTLVKKWDKEVAVEDYEIEHKVYDKFIVYYKMQTEASRLALVKNKSTKELQDQVKANNSLISSSDLISMYVTKMVIKDKVITDKEQIREILEKASPDIRAKLIEENKIEEFFQYIPNFYFNIKCRNDNCLKDFKYKEVDPETEFFRKSVSIY